MVRAILAGQKTQTRRIARTGGVKASGGTLDEQWVYVRGTRHIILLTRNGERVQPPFNGIARACPYGQPGDRLWVREAWAWPGEERFIYRADEWAADLVEKWKTDPNYPQVKWRPSIHMPRKAGRITLEVTGVRVERLQSISEEDAKAEGAAFVDHGKAMIPLSIDGGKTWGNFPSQNAGWSMEHPQPSDHCLGSARMAFANLWNKINGPESWDANPWVWVVEFKKLAEKPL
jgi:hypothetical protein